MRLPDARAATTPAAPPPVADPDEAEAGRLLRICNACRYCEGFCALFQAMVRRLEFDRTDIHYLANLCHGCGACLHACQYAPPHEFAVNVPRTMARVRLATYREYAWPRAFAALYARNGLALAAALACGAALFIGLALALHGTLWRAAPRGDFYRVFSHGLMVDVFGPVFLFALFALGVGVLRFRGRLAPGGLGAAALADAAAAVATLRYLDGGHGRGCNNRDDAFTLAPRRFHQAAFYGFALCFLSTCVATVEHYLLGRSAPYPYASPAPVLGIAGGVALVVGSAGLGWLSLRRHPLQGDPAQRPMDRGFIALLFLVAASGLALAALRQGAAMPLLLAIHLGAVLALFATLPYGKFAHAPFRAAALLVWSIERRRPVLPWIEEEEP